MKTNSVATLSITLTWFRSGWSLNRNSKRQWPATSIYSIYIYIIYVHRCSVCYQVNGPKRAAAHDGVRLFLGDRFNEPSATSHPVSQRLIGVVTFSDLIYPRETLSSDISFFSQRHFSLSLSPFLSFLLPSSTKSSSISTSLSSRGSKVEKEKKKKSG